jgi:hypothetical protein
MASAAVAIETQKFSYLQLPSGLAEQLKGRAERIRIGLARHTSAVIQVGNDLRAAKEQLPHGDFLAWVESEIGISSRAAQLYMRAAAWITGKSEKLSLLPAATLYLLAAPTTPHQVVDEFIRRVETGRPVSYDAVRKRVEAVRRAQSTNCQRHERVKPPQLPPDFDESLFVTDKNAIKIAAEAIVDLLRRSVSPAELERVRKTILNPDVRALPACLGRALIRRLSSP